MSVGNGASVSVGNGWWAVMVGDTGNTGTEMIVGPYRYEATAYEARERIERYLRIAGIEPLADVIEMCDWRAAVSGEGQAM